MSFVDAAGNDTAVLATHVFLWMRCETQADTADIVAWAPWIPTTTIGNGTFVAYPGMLCLWCEVMRVADDARPLGIATNPPDVGK